MEKNDEHLKQTILIADDSEINRSLLADMLGNEYSILEAEDGTQALAYLQNEGAKIDLVLLDIVMPKMDGFEVLAMMNRNGWIKDVPVIVISSETSPSCMERAYELGVTDFINRPFDVWIVRRRVMNTLMLASKQKMLVGMVTDQIFQREKMSNLMITILSHIVEFRNGESGMHVLHIRTISEMILKTLTLKTKQYKLTQTDISLISIASALHDIGKIGIPDEILNKPGKLTKEEFEIMKKHSEYGAAMLDDLDFLQDEKLVQYARQICRWHHERYDGKGYPDGLKQEEIPIAAQVVSLADVYDALTSPRVYKNAYSHEIAIKMILNGECGTFNPLLLECLMEVQEELAKELRVNSFSRNTFQNIKHVTDEILQDDELSTSARTFTLLENERLKTRFFAELSHEVQFEYVIETSLLTIYDFGQKKLGLNELIMNPLQDESVLRIFGEKEVHHFAELVRRTTPKDYAFSMEIPISIEEEKRWIRVSGRSIFQGDPAVRTGIIGKIIDINKERRTLKELQHKATHDLLTLLFNAETAKEKIINLLSNQKEYVMLIIDLDYFKTINDTYGHNFGNLALQHIADKLKNILRRSDIVARIGGDEFLVFFEEHTTQENTINRIFKSLIEPFNNLQLSVSIGVASTKDCGKKYENLFNCADKALYNAKNAGKHCIHHYNPSLVTHQTTFTRIDDLEHENSKYISIESQDELKFFLKNLYEVCERLIVFNVETSQRFEVNSDGELTKSLSNDLYINASRIGAYERALFTKERASEIAYQGKNLYFITSIYLNCDGSPYILEIIMPLKEEIFGNTGYNKTDIIAKIDSLGKKRYADTLTEVFNKQFYEEQLYGTTGFYSLAFLDIKMDINEDLLKKTIAKIRENIRSTDIVIHYSDNEFLILLDKISESQFIRILKNISIDLQKNNIIAQIGYSHALGKIEDVIKNAKKNILLEKE